MLRRYNQVFLGLLKIADMLTVAFAFTLAYVARFTWPIFPEPPSPPNLANHVWAGVSALAAFHVFILSRGLYRSRRSASPIEEARRMAEVSILGTMTVAAVTFFVGEIALSRLTLGLFLVFSCACLIVERALIRATLQALRRRGYNKRSVLIVGTGHLAHELYRRFRDHVELGFQVIGFVGPPQHPSPRPVLGPYSELERIERRHDIDLIFVAIDRSEPEDPIKLVESLRDTAASIRIVPDLVGLPTMHCQSEDFDGLPLICLVDRPVFGWASLTKRLIDILGASLALVVCAPIMLLAALGILVTSPRGGVLYRQRRVSLDGRVFTMLKFRSMVPDAEGDTGPVRARPDDPRRTAIGALLRKTSIDELPQLWNVLKGDMSLVGPRPERPELIEQFRARIPGYMLRHKVKGGLTGLAQISGARGHAPIERRLEYDIEYASRWSLWLDLKILALTLIRVLRDPHAY